MYIHVTLEVHCGFIRGRHDCDCQCNSLIMANKKQKHPYNQKFVPCQVLLFKLFFQSGLYTHIKHMQHSMHTTRPLPSHSCLMSLQIMSLKS